MIITKKYWFLFNKNYRIVNNVSKIKFSIFGLSNYYYLTATYSHENIDSHTHTYPREQAKLIGLEKSDIIY